MHRELLLKFKDGLEYLRNSPCVCNCEKNERGKRV